MSVKPKAKEDYVEDDVDIHVYSTPIGIRDNYELCAQRLDEYGGTEVSYDTINTMGWYFSYPQDAWENKKYLRNKIEKLLCNY